MDDGRTGVLAERQLTLASHFGVTQEGQRYVFIVGTGLGVTQDLGYLLVVAATQHEAHVVESLLRHQRQCFRLHLQDFVSLKLADRHMVFGQQIILRFVFAELEHRRILKFHNICVF